MQLFKDTNFDFLGKKLFFIGLSVLLSIAGIISLNCTPLTMTDCLSHWTGIKQDSLVIPAPSADMLGALEGL